MVIPTRYFSGDKIRVTFAIGQKEVKFIDKYEHDLSKVFDVGSLGQIISDQVGTLELYLEDKAMQWLFKISLSLDKRGRIERFDHPKSWC